MQLQEFDFEFPRELIALKPALRGQARLMAINKSSHHIDYDLKTGDFLNFPKPGDLVVLNNTKVIKARLLGHFDTGGQAEIFLIRQVSTLPHVWEVLLRPGRRMKAGKKIKIGPAWATVLPQAHPKAGVSFIEWDIDGLNFSSFVDQYGEVPLPPYIKRSADKEDDTQYQSVFALVPGSVAAPTASLHLSASMLDNLKNQGVNLAYVTLHVGLGTFSSVEVEDIQNHPMHGEWYQVSAETADLLTSTKSRGGRIFAVGTTVSRVVETFWDQGCIAGEGWTHKFIYPGYKWQGVDALLTNFHWPKSTLFMLVSSLLGTENAQNAYKLAIQENFKLFSYGDAMLIY